MPITLELNSKDDLYTILACLETKEYALQGRIDPRVPRDFDYKSVMDAAEMADSIEVLRKHILFELKNLA